MELMKMKNTKANINGETIQRKPILMFAIEYVVRKHGMAHFLKYINGNFDKENCTYLLLFL